MTAVAAFTEDGRVWMGADSAATHAGTWDVWTTDAEKVFENNGYLIGFAGSFRMGQILRYRFEPPRVPDGCPNLDKFMATRWVDELRAAFRASGFMSYEDGQDFGGTAFLVAYRDRLWCVERDFNVTGDRGGLMAVGSGGNLAVGALRVLNRMALDASPRTRLHEALVIASEHNAAVRGPFHVLHT